jgi:(R)-citramalate synthase
MATFITIMDTTLRDGEQTQGVSFSPDEKLNLAKALLSNLRVDRIEVASARVSAGEQKGVARINAWAQGHGFGEQVEVLGFVDRHKSVDWIVEAGGKVINLLTKGSEKHCTNQLGKTLAQHVEDIKTTVTYAQQQGLSVNVYFEDWSNGYADSPEYVYGLAAALEGCGIDHIMLPDTLGVMSPGEVYDSLRDMTQRFPSHNFDFHPHNDYGLATANVMAAVKAGVTSVHCTVNCLGERAGNASLAEVAVVLKDKMGLSLNIDESHIVGVSQMVESFSGKFVANNTPILGSDVFTQTAGIHADGDVKGNLYVSRLYPERFARKRTYALGKMSGKASLQKNLEEIGISLSLEDQRRVLDRVVQLGDSKQRITTDDLPFIIADVLESNEYQHVILTHCDLNSEWNQQAYADIELEIDGKSYAANGAGNGGFDAFTSAVNSILTELGMQLPELLDYKVHIPRGGQTSALTEASITWQLDGKMKTTTTRGMHANQVFAAIEATLRLLNRLLHDRLQ